MANQQYVWLDGKMIKYDDAKVPILTHSLQYGSGVFEGIRAYKAVKGTAIFRLSDHIKRFFRSMKIYGMLVGFTEQDIEKAIIDLVGRNRLESAYIRPFAFYNDSNIGLSVSGKKTSVAIAAVPFGSYFGGKSRGIKCRISSLHKMNSAILPPTAKGSANYLNSVLASQEAKKVGADEAILLSINGYVAEGPGENIFIVEDNMLITPSKEADILYGITRDSVIRIAGAMGIVVEERNMHREELYVSDEAFFTGTAAEITPIVEIDARPVGNGSIGPITKLVSERYTQITTGNDREFEDWLTYTKK